MSGHSQYVREFLELRRRHSFSTPSTAELWMRRQCVSFLFRLPTEGVFGWMAAARADDAYSDYKLFSKAANEGVIG